MRSVESSFVDRGYRWARASRCRLALADEQCGERPNTAPALQPPLLLTDWAWLARYRDDNAKLIASGAKVDAVFLGDSITEGWAARQPEFFSNIPTGHGAAEATTPPVNAKADAILNNLMEAVGWILRSSSR